MQPAMPLEDYPRVDHILDSQDGGERVPARRAPAEKLRHPQCFSVASSILGKRNFHGSFEGTFKRY
jgi:hypothetical protein